MVHPCSWLQALKLQEAIKKKNHHSPCLTLLCENTTEAEDAGSETEKSINKEEGV